MASNVLTVGAVVSTITFAKTNAEMAQVLRWFVNGFGDPPAEELTPDEARQWNLDRANAKIKEYIMTEARRARHGELKEAQPSVFDQAVTETEI
jgi:hypothetical protein